MDPKSPTDSERTWRDVVRVLAVLWLGLNGLVLLHAGGIALLLLWFLDSAAWARGVLAVVRTPLLFLPLQMAVVLVAVPLMARQREASEPRRARAVVGALRIGLLPWTVASVSSVGYCLATRHFGVAAPRFVLLAVAWIAFALGLLNIAVSVAHNSADRTRP